MSQQQQLQQETILKVSQKNNDTDVLFGEPLTRTEDPRLLTGNSKYVDDIKLPNIHYGHVVRSTYAHALVKKIDISEALRADGVKLVLTAADLETRIALPVRTTSDGLRIPRPVLARDEICFYGEALAFIIADSKAHAEDAGELVKVEYEPLDSVTDLDKAMDDDGPKVHYGSKTNVALTEKLSFGDADQAFRRAFKSIKLEQFNQRVAPAPIETRACLAEFARSSGSLTVWISTQSPFGFRSSIADTLNIPENKIRVIGPEVGGGFGAKLSLYPEDVLVCFSAVKLGLPVKWVESRTENFQSMTHGRGQKQVIEIACDEGGRILALRARLIGDSGAYLTGDSSDVRLTLRMIVGPYKIPAFEGEAIAVFTNKVLHDSYRGAARPEATFGIERAMDELAKEMRMDPAEIRFVNFISKDEFPYDAKVGYLYDSGDYESTLRKALDFSGYETWRDRQRHARFNDDGRLIGIGLTSYVEVCAFDPDSPQTASIVVSPTGKITANVGTFPHGQGHETPFAQIIADTLGIPSIESISVNFGDTSQLPWGTFTAGSRSAALGGTAVLMSARKIKRKMALIAAKNLDTSVDDLTFQKGTVYSKSDSNKKISFENLASISYEPSKLPDGVEPVLFEFSAFAPKNYTFPFGTHVAVVEVERETGMMRILHYCSVDDCGRVINPLIVEGQVHGGIVQGLGQAVLERIEYDRQGQLLTSSFLDYHIPSAQDVPILRTTRTVTPSPSNPIGVKGIGEAGAIAATAAVANAVCDAFSKEITTPQEMPYSPDYLHSLLSKGSA